MIPGLSDEAAEVYRVAEKQPLLAPRPTGTVMDRAQILALIPHRDPFLLVDRVTHLDRETPLIVACYDLARAQPILAGHFPGRPMLPGVLQVEAIGQAATILGLTCWGRPDELDSVALTHVRAARFIRPVGPGGELELVVRVFDDGLFMTAVGQTLQAGVVCAAMAASILPS